MTPNGHARSLEIVVGIGEESRFFASSRDYETYFESDECLSHALPEGAGVLCLFPSGKCPKADKGLAEWCRTNGKLGMEEIPQLLADFLLSGTGELSSEPPGALKQCLASWSGNHTDLLLSRKTEIYSDALDEIVQSALPRPKCFCKEPPPDAETVWGSSQVTDQTLAVTSLAVAWATWTTEQRDLLARLRGLFKGGKDGKGAGDFNKLKPKGGYVSMADDVLPRYIRTTQLSDPPVLQRIREYWSEQDKAELVRLAHLVPLEQFRKLAPSDNHGRLLESLWRVVRGNFNFGNPARKLTEYAQILQLQVIPTLQTARSLEKDVKQVLGITGIDYEDNENLVKAMPGFESFQEITNTCITQPDSSGFPVLQTLLKLYYSSLDVDKAVRSLTSECSKARGAIERVKCTASALVHNYVEYQKAMSFLGIQSEDTVRECVQRHQTIRQNCSLQALYQKATEIAGDFEDISHNLRGLEQKLGDLDNMLKPSEQEE